MFLLVLLALGVQAPDNADYRQGVALIEKGQIQAAIAPLRRAVRAAPQNAQAWKALGVAYASLGEYDTAREPFQQACERNSKLEDACYFLARALYATNRFEASLEALAKALAVDKRPYRVRLAMAQSQEALGRAAEAESNFRAAIALGGAGDDKPGVAYGVFLIRQGRVEESIPPLETVLKRFPDSAAANLEMGRALYQLNRLNKAIELLERAVKLDPASAQAHLLLSRAYFEAGRDTEGQRESELAARGVK